MDQHLAVYFSDRILFLTVSQSPNVEELRSRIWRFLSETEYIDTNAVVPQWNLQSGWAFETRALVVLDDVWSLSVLEQLVVRVPGCKTLVVSRSKFPIVAKQTYEVELLNNNEAMALFCHSAFGQKSAPICADEKLLAQVLFQFSSLTKTL